jgi:hypothetical protein
VPKIDPTVDWMAIRGLYLKGIPAATIATKFNVNVNTVRSRACREGWNELLGISKKSPAIDTEKSAAIGRDIWAERREAIRENIHTIGSRMTSYASQLPEDQLLAKADKVKIATEIAGKIVGLDRQEDKNQVNIAILSSYDDSLTRPSVTQSDTIEGIYSVGYTDDESVDTTTDPTRVGDDDPICP